jgi:regulator of protease activity HflC (stomatin/prohibitin superfamily)
MIMEYIQPFFLILTVEAEQQEQINKAQGEANALLAVAEAKAKGIRLIADALKQTVKYNILF